MQSFLPDYAFKLPLGTRVMLRRRPKSGKEQAGWAMMERPHFRRDMRALTYSNRELDRRVSGPGLDPPSPTGKDPLDQVDWGWSSNRKPYPTPCSLRPETPCRECLQNGSPHTSKGKRPSWYGVTYSHPSTREGEADG